MGATLPEPEAKEEEGFGLTSAAHLACLVEKKLIVRHLAPDRLLFTAH